MSPSHEHHCPVCGATWRCYDHHTNIVIDLWCDECMSDRDEAGC
jgi:hypothetical protein